MGDIVFAEQSWFIVTEKHGKRCKGRLLYTRSGDDREYTFTSPSVERVFRELGKSRA